MTSNVPYSPSVAAEQDPLAEHIRRLGGQSVGWFRSCGAFRIGDVAIVLISRRLTARDLKAALDGFEEAGLHQPKMTIFVEGLEVTSIDRDVLDFYRRDRPRPMPAQVAVVTTNIFRRMLATSVALGFRAFTSVEIRVYDAIEDALAAAEHLPSG